MVPSFVVVILSILLAIAILVLAFSLVDAHSGWAEVKKQKTYGELRDKAHEKELKEYRKVLTDLRDLLPGVYKVLGNSWDYEFGGWDRELVAEIAREKDRKDEGKGTRHILKVLEAYTK